jgi:hypothetical protein
LNSAPRNKRAGSGDAPRSMNWQQTREEDGDLRIEEVADQSLSERATSAEARGRRRPGGACCSPTSGTQPLDAEEAQICRPGELDHRKRRRRLLHDCRNTKCGCDSPERDAHVDPQCGRNRRLPTVHKRVLRHQRHVDTRINHDSDGNQQEGRYVHLLILDSGP